MKYLLSLTDFFSGFLGEKTSADATEEEIQKVQFIVLFSAVGVVSLTVFSLYYLLQGQLLASFVEFTFAVATGVNILFLRLSKRIGFTSHATMALMWGILMFLFYTGGIEGTGILWFYLFPILAFYLVGRINALRWIAALFVWMGIMTLLQVENLIMFPYSPTVIRQLFITLSVCSGFIYFYEVVHEKGRRLIQEKSIQLEIANQNLQTQIKEKDEAEVTLSQNVNELEKVKRATLNLLEDISEAKTKIESEKAKDDAILSSIGDGVVVTDETGTVLFINQATTDLLGWKPDEMVDKCWLDDLPKTENADGTPIAKENRASYQALTSGKKVSANQIYVKKDGSKLPVSVTASPVQLDQKIIGGIVVFRDVTREHEIDRMKTEFISLASHQLRTPLTAMKWFSEMLLSGDAGKLTTEQTDFIKNISDSNERMIELVNGLLNISRIESGRLIVEPVPSDLNSLIEQVLTELKPRIDAKHQHLIFSRHDHLPQINVDPQLIRQVYSNLLTNAMKYTPEEGEISIFLSQKNGAIVSQVSDTGYGIPKSEQSKVFQKFYRGTNITTIETDGTGLGLYLIKSIIESSGGQVWFESEEGKGTSFFFSLPLTGMKEHKGEVHISE